MSILSGFKKFKRYIKTEDDNYILDSEWTSSQTVQMNDGNTLEQNLGGITGITDSLNSESSNVAASAKAVSTLKQSVDKKSDSSHNHDDRYFTEAEVNNLLGSYAQTSHNHDSRYYTETEINNLLSGYAQTSQIGTKITATLSGSTLYLNF